MDLNIVLDANQEIANESGDTFVVGGNIDLGGYTLTISGASGETDLNGIISDTGGLIASSNGRVVLAGGNNYQGTTQVLSGVLVVANATGLGAGGDTPSTGTTLAGEANLEIDGPLTIVNQLLTIAAGADSCVYSNNASNSGVNVWTGDINLDSSPGSYTDLCLEAESGSLEVDGNIAGDAYTTVIAEYGPVILKGNSSVGSFGAGSDSSVQLCNSFAVSGYYEVDYGSTTQVVGSLTGNYVDVYGAMEVDGTLTVNGDGYISGTISGTGTIATPNAAELDVYGQVAPGNASGPGTLQIGNAYFYNGSALNAQLGGASPGTYGQLQIAAGDTVYLDGGV